MTIRNPALLCCNQPDKNSYVCFYGDPVRQPTRQELSCFIIQKKVSQLFQIYKSSAGSGKTYTLVKEYLKIVLRDPSRVPGILAITFTNAAAAEMKGRIIHELGNLSALAPSGKTPGLKEPGTSLPGSLQEKESRALNLLRQINGEWIGEGLDPLPEDRLVAHAGEVLKSILHNYSDFSVSTIDSFVHRVIRTFAFDLHLPLNFEVELDANALLRQAVDLLISRAGADSASTRLLISFILNQAEEEKDLRIENQIAGLAKTLMDEDGSIPLQKIKTISLEDFLEISRKIKKSVRDFDKQTRTIARQAFALIEKNQLTQNDFYHKGSGIYAYFRNLALGTGSGDPLKVNTYVRKTIDENNWYSGQTGQAEKERIDAIKEDLIRAFEEINGREGRRLIHYKTLMAVGKNIFPVAVLNEVEKVLDEIKAEHVLLHISDFNKKIAAIIAEQPVPFIYERLGERYQHYMIDEFQDTSVLQWQNLIPLVENALAGGNMSLVVGDGKQAIYRFRNGDVEQFAMLPRLSREIRATAREEWERSLIAAHVEKNLDTNYRSQKEIVGFNNRFFSFASPVLSEPLQKVYDQSDQKNLPKKNGGFVELAFMDAEGSSYNDQTLEAIVDAISRCSQAGHPLGDVTILCRAANEASMVARFLLGNQIPVISSESLLLSQSDEVNFILALLKLITNPTDQVAALEAITFLQGSKMAGLPGGLHERLREAGLFARPPGQPPPHLHQPIEALFEKNGISFSFAGFAHQNLYDICETIIRTFFAGEKPPSPFVAFFSDAVFDYAGKNKLSVPDFLEWWEENGENHSLIVPEGVDAVRVMTIHKSKGLQFPVVIVPFAHKSGGKLTKQGQWVDVDLEESPGLETTWVSLSQIPLAGTPFEPYYEQEKSKSMLDMLNLVYVAFTRPSEKLFIFTKAARQFKMEATHGLLHHFLRKEGRWQESQKVYQFGNFDPAAKSTDQPRPVQKLFRKIISNPWSRALRMRSHQEERRTAIGGEDPLMRGSLIHRAMEKIFSANDVEPVLLQMMGQGEIDQQQLLEWKEKINRLIGQPEIAPYFAEGLTTKPEAGLFDQNGNFFRPDRVVLMKDQTVVIDYKTGKAYQKHREQINRYAGLLSEMGYPNLKKMILYLDENKVEVV